MPLNRHHKSIGAWIFHRFDEAIRWPGCCDKIGAYRFDCLMIMTIDERINRPGYRRQLAILQEAYAVRMTVARYALLMFDCLRYLRSDVLNQSSASRNV